MDKGKQKCSRMQRKAERPTAGRVDRGTITGSLAQVGVWRDARDSLGVTDPQLLDMVLPLVRDLKARAHIRNMPGVGGGQYAE